MARPENFNDLPSWDRQPVKVATVEVSQLATVDLHLAHAMLALLAAADNAGLHVDRESGEVTRPFTDKECNALLASAQNSWDYKHERYLEAIADPASFDKNYRWAANSHAREENLPAVKWPEADTNNDEEN